MDYSTDSALQQEVLQWLKGHQRGAGLPPRPNALQQVTLGDLPPTALGRDLLGVLRAARTGALTVPDTGEIPLLP